MFAISTLLRPVRVAIAKLQKPGKERPASTASLVPAALISKARRVHGMSNLTACLRSNRRDQEEPRKRAKLVPEKSQTLAVAWLVPEHMKKT